MQPPEPESLQHKIFFTSPTHDSSDTYDPWATPAPASFPTPVCHPAHRGGDHSLRSPVGKSEHTGHACPAVCCFPPLPDEKPVRFPKHVSKSPSPPPPPPDRPDPLPCRRRGRAIDHPRQAGRRGRLPAGRRHRSHHAQRPAGHHL